MVLSNHVSEPVYLQYTQAELDACYDQRVWARDAEAALALIGSSSEGARSTTSHHGDLSYGPSPEQRLDWFHTPASNAPVHIHIHGGAWRNLTKADASFAAPAFVAAGMHYVVPNFAKLPAVRLPDMVEQLVAAVAFIHRVAAEHGGDPGRLLLSGHSSGAHLAAVLMTLDWEARGLPVDIIKAGLCASGSYDLEPVMLSARRDYIQITPEEARALSPRLQAGAIRCPVTIVYGGRESPEFIRQAEVFAADLAAAGGEASLVRVPDADHFDVNAALGQPGSPVHALALEAVAAMSGSGAVR